MNAFETMKEFYLLDEEILKLSNELQRTNNVTDRERLERSIDHKLSLQLEIKHKMERVSV